MLSLLTPQSQQNLTCSPGKGEPHSWQNLASGAAEPLLDTSDKGGISKMQALSTWIIRQYGPSPNIIQYYSSPSQCPPSSSACWVEGVRVREGKRCFQLLVEAARRLLERASPSLGSV